MTEVKQPANPDHLRQLCADLSLRCPGFAILRYLDGQVTIEQLCHLDSRSSKAPHGKVLSDIYALLLSLSKGIDVFVRERAFSRFPHETQALSKVVGIADLTAWQAAEATYDELAPTTIKKLQTGSGKATKKEVADSLSAHIGHTTFTTDDESDAVAAGVAWLLANKLL